MNSHTTTPDSESFYLSGSVANLDDYGKRRHSTSSTSRGSGSIHDQLLHAQHDEDSERGQSTPPYHGEESSGATACIDHSHDLERPSVHLTSTHCDEPIPTPELSQPFYSHPRRRRIRMEGEFKWYRSQGDRPIDSPPPRSTIDVRNPFREADVVVHEALPSNTV